MNQREYLENPQNLCVDLGGDFHIVHGRNPRAHICFDKVNNGPMYKMISSLKFIFTFYKWPHKSQTKPKASIVNQFHLTTH
jgi:hypothetical protein